ncbi:MAG TPA: hypothetical protein VEG27_11265, partial [Usitatibacter sp.]|nr:hypothetical protein [Usitatibacter sp.]
MSDQETGNPAAHSLGGTAPGKARSGAPAAADPRQAEVERVIAALLACCHADLARRALAELARIAPASPWV